MLEYLTRRRFLSTSILTSSALVGAPILVKNLFKEVSAVADVAPLAFPLVQIHGRGGHGPWNASVPRDSGGEILSGPALGTYGCNPSSPPIISRFGNEFLNFGANDFIDGILTHLSTPELQSQVIEFSIAATSQDDNGTNPCGLSSIFHAAKVPSTPLLNTVGFQSTQTGMPNSPAISDRTSPFIVSRASEIPKQAEYAVSFDVNRAGERERIANLANALKLLATSAMASTEGFKMAQKTAIQQSHHENLQYVNGNPAISALDLFTSDLPGPENYKSLFGINDPAVQDNQISFRMAMSLRYLLNGYIHFAGFNFTGLDYHQNEEPSTRARDNEIGQTIGKIAKLAILERKNVCIVLTTDGSVNGAPENSPLVRALGDRGNLTKWSFWVVMGTPGTSVTLLKKQIGAKKRESGITDTTTLTGKNDMTAAAALAANVLYLNGIPLDKILGILPLFRDEAILRSHLAIRLG